MTIIAGILLLLEFNVAAFHENELIKASLTKGEI